MGYAYRCSNVYDWKCFFYLANIFDLTLRLSLSEKKFLGKFSWNVMLSIVVGGVLLGAETICIPGYRLIALVICPQYNLEYYVASPQGATEERFLLDQSVFNFPSSVVSSGVLACDLSDHLAVFSFFLFVMNSKDII